jgi:UDP-N-acetylglucosamine/UDP-N-acetylgalactosamine 4-epimerase
MPNTYLITGGAGFIGSHLAISLASRGQRVRVLDNFSGSPRSQFERLIQDSGVDVEIVEGDIRDRSTCRLAMSGMEYVLHHAAMASVVKSITSPDECVSVNVLGTANLLMEAHAADCCRRFVFASSSAVYGDLPELRKTEESAKDPLSPYATTKLACEHLCRNYSQVHGLHSVSLRYFNVFGCRQDPNGPYAAVIPKFIREIKQGGLPTIYGDGEQSRDFVAVEDVVQANISACDSRPADVSGESFNIGSGLSVTVNQLVKEMSAIVGRSILPTYIPSKKGDIRHSAADITKACRLLNYSPQIALRDGLTELFG